MPSPLVTTNPLVSVIMAARNVSPYIEAALSSILGQTLTDLEIVVVDDQSTDGTAAAIQAIAATDSRVRLLTGRGEGPAAARNLAISKARGEWLAVVDADDIIMPGRLQVMVHAAVESAADLVADNLIAFYDDLRPEHDWLTGVAWSTARDIKLDDYFDASPASTGQNPLGYLKPIFRRQMLAERSLSYDESLTIGEDYDLVARALATGARFRYVPSAGYRYRRHASSISYRINATQLQNMLDGLDRLDAIVPPIHRAALDSKREIVRADLQFSRTVAGIKRGSVAALAHALIHAETRKRLVTAAREGLERRLSRNERPT